MAEDSRKPKGERQKALESDPGLGEPGPTGGAGRSGGGLARNVGTRDEEKRAFERPAGKTRVRKSDEKDVPPPEGPTRKNTD